MLLEDEDFFGGHGHIVLFAHNFLDHLGVVVVQAHVFVTVESQGVVLHGDGSFQRIDGAVVVIDTAYGVLLEKEDIDDESHDEKSGYRKIFMAPDKETAHDKRFFRSVGVEVRYRFSPICKGGRQDESLPALLSRRLRLSLSCPRDGNRPESRRW